MKRYSSSSASIEVPETPSPKVVETYLKVKAKAEGTSGPEKATAEQILRNMEAKYPLLAQIAEASARAKAREAIDPSWMDNETDEDDDDDEMDARYRNVDWNNLFEWARATASNVYGFAETMANAAVGRQLADLVEGQTRKTGSGFHHVALRMPSTVYRKAAQLNPLQQAAFRQAMHEILDEQLDKFLGES